MRATGSAARPQIQLFLQRLQQPTLGKALGSTLYYLGRLRQTNGQTTDYT